MFFLEPPLVVVLSAETEAHLADHGGRHHTRHMSDSAWILISTGCH